MDAIRTRHDAVIFRALKEFPEKLEGKFLGANEFKRHFKDFHGRPVQDIVEALRHYSQGGCFKTEIMLNAEYLKHGNTLNQVMSALAGLQSDPKIASDSYKQLGEQVYSKVISVQTLSIAEVSHLPQKAKQYLEFKLFDIDRHLIRRELAIYNDNTFIQSSRLAKHGQIEPAFREARVLMGGENGEFVQVFVTNEDSYSIAKLQVGRAPYNFMHYILRPENWDIDISIKDIKENVANCAGRNDMTELVGDCGFNKSLKDAFFLKTKNNKVHFKPKSHLNSKQFNVLKKQDTKIRKKS